MQVARLMGKRFVAATPSSACSTTRVYLKAAALRPRQAEVRSRPGFAPDGRIRPLWTNYERRAGRWRNRAWSTNLEQFRWLLEELRVSLFAQELKTPTPVSTKRLQKTWEGLARG